MMARMGPLLERALERINGADEFRRSAEVSAVAAHVAAGANAEMLPLVVQLTPLEPEEGESWASYKERCALAWRGVEEDLEELDTRILIAANAVACVMPMQSLQGRIEAMDDSWLVELDTRVKPILMDDCRGSGISVEQWCADRRRHSPGGA